MTTIVYRDGALYADRKSRLDNVVSEGIYIDAPKLFTHPSRKLAFTYSATINDYFNKDTFGDYLIFIITEHLKDTTKPVDKTELDKMFVASYTIVAITKTSAFMIDSESDKISNLDRSPYYTTGSGQWGALACLLENQPIDKLYKIVAGIDFGTSSKFDRVEKRKLLKF